jgi:hypothetical protein
LDITIFLSTNVIYIILGKNSRPNKNQQMALIICFGKSSKSSKSNQEVSVDLEDNWYEDE